MELKTKSVKGMQLKHMITKSLYFDKAMSCAELSELFDKSIPSIAKALNELIEKGFVVEQGYAPSSGGRRPLMYAINANAMYILAIAMDQVNTRIQLVDLRNQPVSEMMMFELKLIGNNGALGKLVEYINKYLSNCGVLKDKIAGIGIGMPGFIDPVEGINYTYLKTEDKSLSQYISDETGLPTFIDNDSSLIALAEQKFGIAKWQKEVMVINLSWVLVWG
jgi:predicted transcriptional regulator